MIAFLPVITALIYLLVAVNYWRRAGSSKAAVSSRQPWQSVLIAAGLALHALTLYCHLFSQGLNLSFTNALSTILWLTVLIYWITNVKHNLHSLQAFVLPPAAFFVLLQAWQPESHVIPYADQPLFVAHLVIAMLAYSLLTFAALHALLMTAAERKLHQKSSWLRLPDFPPLMAMETLLFRIITLGFILLTLTLISGMMFSELLFDQPFQFNHKNVFTILSWLIFSGLLFGRYRYGWRGRTAVRWTLSGFVLLLLAYAGSKFVLEVLLHR
ncbi:cytochrome C assembly family protein [Methylobacillus flagellatus]|uniref:Cytochrome c assembly protein n=1 Tax=Methylobacillus flagellatus (strain ATCC 51484 / DSM 6875 / VKM B-1610 / KT) TaxID=265072 RepID=Q1H3Z6_METFK|nr:cytochrome c biogenesis protein CcsA [Methylobacillus flagellatus]ABE48791.1 cytochrome c assembly protein [Methylobacillus flagellatus KT]